MVTVPDLIFGGLLVVLTHTHAKVRIGCISSHITVSHCLFPFYSVGKVVNHQIYIYYLFVLLYFGSSSRYNHITGLYCGLGFIG